MISEEMITQIFNKDLLKDNEDLLFPIMKDLQTLNAIQEVLPKSNKDSASEAIVCIDKIDRNAIKSITSCGVKTIVIEDQWISKVKEALIRLEKIEEILSKNNE